MARSLDAHSLGAIGVQLQCPGCRARVAVNAPACGQCSYDFTRLSLHDPSRFLWQSLLFSFAFPALLIADNWRRVGKRGQALAWLFASCGGFVFLSGLSLALPGLDQAGTLLLASMINVPAALVLERTQRPVFQGYRSLGSGRISRLREIGGGIMLVGTYFLANSILIPDLPF